MVDAGTNGPHRDAEQSILSKPLVPSLYSGAAIGMERVTLLADTRLSNDSHQAPVVLHMERLRESSFKRQARLFSQL